MGRVSYENTFLLYRYVLHDPHSLSKEHVYDDRNGIPWKSWKDPAPLKVTGIGKRLKTVVNSIHRQSKNSSVNFDLNEVYAALIRRGDRTNLVAECNKDEESYHVALFMNMVWRKNAYGELLLYDDDGEILTSVRPKFGRIVVWHSSIEYILRPPSIAQLATESVIIMHFGADVDMNSQKQQHYKALVDELRRPPTLLSWVEKHKNRPADELDLDKHLTLYRKNKKNHFVAVFDGLFNEAALSTIRAWTIKYGLYFFDGSLDLSSDNVQWIAGINIHDFIETDFWPIIKKVAAYVSKTSDWYPYDVACNLIRSYDHTRFHLDTTDSYEKEMTFLLYLSPNWTAVDYGETAFMETNDDNKYNEYVAEVVPTFGRAVIFDGNFPHSAHPPSVLHYNARYTLAVKLSYNKLIAVQKTFIEEKKHEPVMTSSFNNILQLKMDPSHTVASSKVRAVVDHLGTRNLQRKVSGADFGEENKITQNEYEDMGSEEGPGEDEYDDISPLLEVLEDEMEASLTLQQQKMVKEMIKFHNLQGPSSNAAAALPQDSVMEHFNDEKRENILAQWGRVSRKNADVLSDYQELYLRQRLWLKDHVMGKMTTLL